MEVRIRSWCCGLRAFVVVIGSMQAAVYVIAGLGLVGWYLVSNSRGVSQTFESVVEVSNLSEFLPELDSTSDSLLRILCTGLGIAFLGFLSSLFLIFGAQFRKRFLLLPWLISHFIIITLIFVAGLYLIINYTIILEDKDYLKASLSLFFIVAGILLIFTWILVDQFYILLGANKTLGSGGAGSVSSSSLAGSRVSRSSTFRIARGDGSKYSEEDYPKYPRKQTTLSHISTSRLDNPRMKHYSMNIALPASIHKERYSRSMDNLYDDGYREQDLGKKTLPKRKVKYTGSLKSVTMDPKVLEYHYQQQGYSSNNSSQTLVKPGPKKNRGQNIWIEDRNPSGVETFPRRVKPTNSSSTKPTDSEGFPKHNNLDGNSRLPNYENWPKDAASGIQSSWTKPTISINRNQNKSALRESASLDNLDFLDGSNYLDMEPSVPDVSSSVPTPVYPRGSMGASLDRRLLRGLSKPRGLTKEQIIDRYTDSYSDVQL